MNNTVDDPLGGFHPAIVNWFKRRFAIPTAPQIAAWPAIRAGRNTLVAAPTGSGKTLTAFLAAIDALVQRGLSEGGLPDETALLYVSPLKALSNDVRANLESPLEGIREELARLGLPEVVIRTAVRTGDTPQNERQRAIRRPPHLLVTTPESLYVLLGSDSGRKMLSTVRSVIVDEIHAIASSKRGSHLALSLERLQSICAEPLVRIGLSATQKPIDQVARFLVGAGSGQAPECELVDIGYAKRRDLSIEVPVSPLGAVMSNDQWEQTYSRLTELVCQHRTTLVFVNTRRMAERASRHLGERLGKELVAAHHGSLAKEARLYAEQRLKHGELKVLVATASLELGLDIGDVDLVCQLGSPRSIATFLQRAGRSGHAVDGLPKARLFPQSRDELVECTALLDCVRRGELDRLSLAPAALDVLAQQIVAEIGAREWDEGELFALVRRASPYAALDQKAFVEVLRMVSEGFTTRQGQRGGYVHRDLVHHQLRARRGARLTALTSGGTIPETGDYTVFLEPEAQKIGSVNEDFAVESLAGDVFQLGNTSYRILGIEAGRVRVVDAKGAAPSIPFWLGEAPGRTDELSFGVSRLREEVAAHLEADGSEATATWIAHEIGVCQAAAAQVADYVARSVAALGSVPTQASLVFERFFDESGGMQLVIHTPYGSRLNRAWGLALRKRFCRQFNFELQAAATEDAIVLSLSTSHSFPLDEVVRYLHSATALQVLVQALLDAPLFAVRWRWNASTALALPRFVGGRKVAPPLLRMRAEDLLAAVFPDQVACAENLAGERQVPEHPLVAQTLEDCLYEAMDARGWLRLLQQIESGHVNVAFRDLPAPSPMAAEALNARPYAFLDDAPIEERRTQAVQSRRYNEQGLGDDFGRLDADAIARVCEEAWPDVRSADEMHEALCSLGFITDFEVTQKEGWQAWMQELAAASRATHVVRDASADPGDGFWVAAERLAQIVVLYPRASMHPCISALVDHSSPHVPNEEEILQDVLRSRLGALGPSRVDELEGSLGFPRERIEAVLIALQTEGSILQGRFREGAGSVEWCERHLLARIHRYTLSRLRREIEPVEPRVFARFLFEWQHVSDDGRLSGGQALPALLSQLEGYEAPAAVWESEILPARLKDYTPGWLDELCIAGRTSWTRLRPTTSTRRASGSSSLRSAPIVLVPRKALGIWSRLAPAGAQEAGLTPRAARVTEFLAEHGASFFDEIAQETHLLAAELESALSELVVRGRAHCDSYAGLRALLVPSAKRAQQQSRHRRRSSWLGIQDAGRWTLIRQRGTAPLDDLAAAARIDDIEHLARILLGRYGVVCWRVIEREAAWLPPWRDLVRSYRRLEARGEIRGGRFIAGVSGEQFALPEAIGLLREVRRRPADLRLVCVAATDPANLLGTILPGPKVPRVVGARVLYRDGLAVATQVAGQVSFLETLDAADRNLVTRALLLNPSLRSEARAHEGAH